MRTRPAQRLDALVAIAAAVLIAACVVSPEREAEIGRAAAKQVADEMGLVDDDALRSYIGEIGARIAAVSPRTNVQYQFHVVDLPEPNAFALPGGYIYVSRGILTLANSEDELANVMSHEVAHVIARHSAERSARAQGVGLLAVLGTVAAAVYGGAEAAQTVGQLGQIAGAGLIASYSRDQEREADHLGQELAAKQGWDPAAMTSFLRSLGRDVALRRGEARNPSFLDSHPSTPERIANTASRARGLTRGPGHPLAPGRAEFLARIEGTLVGPNPAGGLFEDNHFVHPDLDLQLRFPSGWKTTNSRSFVGGMKQDGSAMIKLEIQAPGSDPERAAREFLASGGLEVVEHGQRRVGGLPGYHAVAVVMTQQGQIAADLTWIAHRGHIYRFSGLTPENLYREYAQVFARTVQSFRPLNPMERASIHKVTLRVATARTGETLQRFSRRTGNTWSPEETVVANGIETDARLRAGQRLKIAIAEPYRSTGETR